MSETPRLQGIAKNVVTDFLKAILPFSDLDRSALSGLATSAIVGFFPKGTIIFRQDVTEVKHLFVIQSGAVRMYLASENGGESLMDVRGEGGHFGALSLISGSKPALNVQTLEDTFCFLLDKKNFLDLVAGNSRVAQYYLKRLSQDLVGSAYLELRSRKLVARSDGSLHLFKAKVGDLIKGLPDTISESASVHEAAQRMSELGSASLLIRSADKEIIGIVTDSDIRKKVVACRLGFDEPVSRIMSSPLLSIDSEALCFDAVLRMMNRSVQHLAVSKTNEILGVVTAHDILVFQGSSPLNLLQEITAQRKIEGLYHLSQKTPAVVRGLIEEGAKAESITRAISLLNDRILERVLGLILERMGPPPLPFAWLIAGSEGRREQTFRTDQDNALIYDDPGEEWEQVKDSKLYFRYFCNEASEHLAKCGYPQCAGGFMASKSKWRKSYPVWIGYFDEWMSSADPESIVKAKTFSDFRCGYGSLELAGRFREHITQECLTRKSFAMNLAKDTLTHQPPLSFLRNFIVEKNGEHKNGLAIKLRGLTPIADFARMMALKNGITETNTRTRLQILHEDKQIPPELFSDTLEAYDFLMQLRLVHQLRMIEAGQQPHNFIDPGELSDLEKKALKQAFGVINAIQTFTSKLRF